MHYRCKECAEMFALERIRESGAPRTSASFCPFCGAQGAGLASLQSIKPESYSKRDADVLVNLQRERAPGMARLDG